MGEASVLRIEGRRRTNSTGFASYRDFVCRGWEGEPAEDPTAAISARANVTPYCLDHDGRRVIFAETPAEIDLSDAPFYYQAQFEAATRLFAAPYDLVPAMAAQTVARFERLVFVFSVGRCGSTLVSRIWRELDDAYSLSEPDVFTDVSRLREQRALGDDEAARLVEATTRLLHKPRRAGEWFVVKVRARCIDIAELIHQVFPSAGMIFMYRNAIDCIDSHVRVFGDEPVSIASFREAFPLAAAGPEYYGRLGRLGRPLLGWAAGVQTYLGMRERGVPIRALRYENIVEAPEHSVERLLLDCGAPRLSVDRVRGVMRQDAQAGTKLARNGDGRRTLVPGEVDLIASFLESHAGISPDVVLPGTINA